MNLDELNKDRELIGRILVNNLKKYGTFEPPGFNNGLPTHGTGSDMAPMSHANYLRTAAYLRQNSPTNPHFVSLAEAKELKLKIKNGARPLYLEEWFGSVEQGFDYMLKPYYNVTDLVGSHERIKPLLQLPQSEISDNMQKLAQEISYTDSDKDYYAEGVTSPGYDEFMKNCGNLTEVSHHLQEVIINTIKGMAGEATTNAKKRHYIINTVLISQMLLKKYHLNYINDPPNVGRGIIIGNLDKNPLAIFNAISEAHDIIAQMTISSKENLTEATKAVATDDVITITPSDSETTAKAKATSQDNTITTATPTTDSKTTEPKQLVITVWECNSELDLSKYRDHLASGDTQYTLRDKDAFEFLRKMIYLDAEYFHNSEHYQDHNGKFEFRLDYGAPPTSITAMRMMCSGQLGTLFFKGQNTAHDAIITGLSKSLLDEYKDHLKDFAHAEQESISNIDDASLPFIDFNSPVKVNPYIYISQDKESVKDYILRDATDDELKNYCAIPANKSAEVLKDLATIGICNEDYLIERNGLPNSFYAFASAYKPEHMKDSPTLLAVKSADIKAIQAVSKLSVDLKMASLLTKPTIADRVHGIDSLTRILIQRDSDGSDFRYAVKNNAFPIATQSKVSMQVNVDNEQVLDFNYIIGENNFELFRDTRSVKSFCRALELAASSLYDDTNLSIDIQNSKRDNALTLISDISKGINLYSHYADTHLISNFNDTLTPKNETLRTSTDLWGNTVSKPPSPETSFKQWDINYSINNGGINSIREHIAEMPSKEIQETTVPIPSVPLEHYSTNLAFNMFMQYASYSDEVKEEADLYKVACQKMIDCGLSSHEIYKAVPYCKEQEFIMSCFDKVTNNLANKEKLDKNFEDANNFYNKKGFIK